MQQSWSNSGSRNAAVFIAANIQINFTAPSSSRSGKLKARARHQQSFILEGNLAERVSGCELFYQFFGH